MASDRPRVSVDPDGVRVTTSGRRSVVLPVLLAVVVVGWVAVRTLGGEDSPPGAAPAPVAPAPTARIAENVASSPAADAAVAPAAPIPSSELAERVRQRREERAVERREKTEAPYTLNPPGEHAGIDAFPPPGTKPIKRGIIVPDDFELPQGYVRHYQTTDDGRSLPPILMFHPDAAGVDENGNPVLAPEQRIVPPDLAPPGLPHRMLDETRDAGEPVGRRVHSDPTPPARRH